MLRHTHLDKLYEPSKQRNSMDTYVVNTGQSLEEMLEKQATNLVREFRIPLKSDLRRAVNKRREIETKAREHLSNSLKKGKYSNASNFREVHDDALKALSTLIAELSAEVTK